MRAALVNASGVVDNLILLDENGDYTPDKGLTLIILDEQDKVEIGDQWAGGNWTPSVPVELEEMPQSLEEQIAELQETVQFLVIRALEA